ncbi:aminoalkylphosphonate N-acetyltransferase [Phycisphaerales bacterium]|nr:aminoalkylphosphonate N-acetyltransferase [Phycisphaerales bacterium]
MNTPQRAGSPTIVQARSAEQLRAFESLCREYAASLPFSLCFQGFEDEMRTLPGKYAPPSGRILLAMVGDQYAGCVALREIPTLDGDAGPVCEMKRMFVRPEFRGLGLGRLLAVRLLEEAKAAGYGTMKLDSEDTFVAATALYRTLGFVETARYNDDPHPHTIWMAKRL